MRDSLLFSVRRFARPPALAALALAFVLSQEAAQAQSRDGEQRLPEAFERDLRNMEAATEQIMQALQLFLLAIPQYEAPVVLDNGDILIRRRRNGDRLPEDGRRRPRTPFDLFQQFEQFGRELEKGRRHFEQDEEDDHRRRDRKPPRILQGDRPERNGDPVPLVPETPRRYKDDPDKRELFEPDWELKT